MSGPKFISTMLGRCPKVRFETNTTITAIRAHGEFDIATPSGISTIHARHIVLATGARETPRHARLVSGLRPTGVTTTGALQQFIHNTKTRPFSRAVIVGTELVSFSALWTMRGAGIKAVAMIEENSRVTAYRPAALFARILGVPIHYNATISDIGDIASVQQITIDSPKAGQQKIDCDGVIFSGKFTGENTLARDSHLARCTGTQLPLVDQNWLSSDPVVSVIGNATHPADMGDQCYQEGRKAGKYIAEILAGKISPPTAYLTINHNDGIQFTTPNIVRPDDGVFGISLHVTKPYTGPVQVSVKGQLIYRKTRRCRPTRRITLKNIQITEGQFGTENVITISVGHSAPEPLSNNKT